MILLQVLPLSSDLQVYWTYTKKRLSNQILLNEKDNFLCYLNLPMTKPPGGF
jgi:hypothetical protein